MLNMLQRGENSRGNLKNTRYLGEPIAARLNLGQSLVPETYTEKELEFSSRSFAFSRLILHNFMLPTSVSFIET